MAIRAFFYKTYKELLIPQLIEVYAEALEMGVLPPTLREAVVILLLKPGKDPLSCGSYRPLSLLNYDNKILAKVLSMRLSLLLDQIVSPEQSGFVPQRSTSLNLHTVFTTLHRVDPTIPAVIRCWKAFDSLEWPFLHALLKRRGFPNQFTALVSLLYTQPTARLRLNSTLSTTFPILRGTRQGCPLSPLLFILARTHWYAAFKLTIYIGEYVLRQAPYWCLYMQTTFYCSSVTRRRTYPL